MPAIARRDQVEEAERAHLAKDPVCGMSVDPHTAKYRREHGGRDLLLLLGGLRARSSRRRRRRISAPSGRRRHAAPADAIYTCPMHPEIEQVGPGACPICGMALEPKTVTLEDEGRTPSCAT